MSRQRERIERALREKGYTATRIHWEPVSAGAEKCGPDGGWFIAVDPLAPVKGVAGGEDCVVGLNVDDVLADIARLPSLLAELHGASR